MKKNIISFCLIAFLLIENYLINTEHITLISIRKDKYRIYFDSSNEYYSTMVYIDVSKSNVPKLIEQLLQTNKEAI